VLFVNSNKKMFYGWWIVLGCFLIMAATTGIVMNSIPNAYGPIAAEFGFQIGEVSTTTALVALAAMFTALLVGRLMKSLNVRILTTIFGCFVIAGLLSYSVCTTLKQFYIASIVIGVGAAGTYLIPPSVILTNWFEEKRGLAIAITFTGAGIGGAVFGPLLTYLMGTVGVSRSFLFMGIISAILILPITIFLLRLTPQEKGLLPFGKINDETEKNPQDEVLIEKTGGLTIGQALKTSSFWMLAFSILFFAAATLGVNMHIPNYFTTAGYSAAFAAGIFAASNFILTFGKLALGSVIDRYGVRNSMYFIFAIGFLTMLLIIPAADIKWLTYIFAAVSGFAAAIMTIPAALWTAAIMGKKDFAIIYSVMNVFLTLGVALGSPISGFILDAQGSYLPALKLWAVVLAVSMILALLSYHKRPALD
jgi:MFS family permease